MRLYRADHTGLYMVAEGLTGPDGTVTFSGEAIVVTSYKVWEEARECWEPTTPEINGPWEGGYYTRITLGWDDQSATVVFGNTNTCEPTPPPPSGCSLTPGYWKTHSEYGPAPYDATWAELPNGADTPFFDTGKSWYEVLHTKPKRGNAYYILARAYIAAYLNDLNGADTTIISDKMDTAASLLDKYDGNPKSMRKIRRRVRRRFIRIASRLDEHNNGCIGPGHCP